MTAFMAIKVLLALGCGVLVFLITENIPPFNKTKFS